MRNAGGKFLECGLSRVKEILPNCNEADALFQLLGVSGEEIAIISRRARKLLRAVSEIYGEE